MGMFSWCCKGCGQELVAGELCRLDGCKGEYDGYGRCGNFDYDCGTAPAAWHQTCYQKATPEQKLDETPSPHAPNQGFGPAHLEFVPGYDPQAETKYIVTYETWKSLYIDEILETWEDAETRTYHRWFLTPTGPQDQEDFEAARREAEQAINDLDPTQMAEMYGEWSKAFEDLDTRFNNPPEQNAIQFATLDEAKQAAATAVKDHPEYVLFIDGVQEKASGMVYHHSRLPNIRYYRETKKSEIPGNPDVVECKYEKIGIIEKTHYDQATRV
jgi:hypothetical protein